MRNPLTRLMQRATLVYRSPAPAPEPPKSAPLPPAPKLAEVPAQRGRLARLGDGTVLFVAVLVMAAVGGAAGYISFRHFVTLAIGLGEAPSEAFLYPAVAEGMIVIASLVMLYCSRRALPVPWLAWLTLVFGVAVAIVVNVIYGLERGIGAAMLAGLAPIAFLFSYELLMRLIRLVRQAAAQDAEPVEPHVCPEPERIEVVKRVEVPVEKLIERIVERPVEKVVETVVEQPVPIVPTDNLDAARIAYEHSLTGPRPMGQRRLATLFGLTSAAAKEIIETVQATRSEALDKAPDNSRTVTVTGRSSEPGDDRHETVSASPDSEPAEPLADEPAVTVPEPANRTVQDRHADPADTPSDEAEPETVRPAETADSVTVSEAAENRHATDTDTPAETPGDEPGDEPAVTAADAPEMTVMEPLTVIPPDTPTRLLTQPYNDAPVPVLNGAHSTVTPTGEDDAR